MSTPRIGDQAPDLQLQDQSGDTLSLSQFAGKHVVLYFYPKDDTPGCTKEACSFRDEHSALQAAGAVVLGVSTDDSRSHQKFATKYSLPFPLLADTEHKLAEAYGVWGEKSLYGRKFMGITRATFLIDPEGKVSHVWPKVKPEGHAAEVLEALRAGGAKAPAAQPEATAPARPKAAPKKAAPPKAAAKRASAPKASAKRAAPPKAAAKRAAPPKASAKKAAPPKAAAKRASAPKAALKQTARKAAAKQGAAKKTARRAAPSKPAARPARRSRR